MVWPYMAELGGKVLGAFGQAYANRRNYRAQREFAQHGVRWRVEDAKAAGIHPLFALGYQGPGFSPSFGNVAGGLSDVASGSIASSMRRKQTSQERQLFDVKLRQEEAKAKLFEFQSEALGRKLNAPTQQPPPLNELGVIQYPSEAVSESPAEIVSNQVGAQGVAAPGVQYIPNRVTMSESRGVSAGKAPLYDRFVTPGGAVVMAPNERLAETLESYFPTRFRMYWEDAKRFGARAKMNWYRSPRAIAALKATRPRNLPAGTEARWSAANAAWQIVKIGPEGSQLFLYDSVPGYVLRTARGATRLARRALRRTRYSSRPYPRGYVGP